MNPEIAAYIGYSASLFIVLSFILKDVRKIRIVNMIGCICFVVYGIFNGMLWPVIIPNGIICFIQIYYLLFDKNKK
ncbi:uroporphyrinogen decarboxylase [Chryseobacterium salviniae]|uniref:Uroporphyrinogen decarboxylase n=1 Tax=Chryseobacterium salviniae TaxID=3101750 RepID=A0ABU6HM07_9FLAO|nr:uroporphyrinogen decarboxylase [Chryseobacterium sp. T9W2-O]MEC3874095.1 uroporphyrinogen decarboxylase [Chryseobacterium sp. T9W2-O]